MRSPFDPLTAKEFILAKATDVDRQASDKDGKALRLEREARQIRDEAEEDRKFAADLRAQVTA